MKAFTYYLKNAAIYYVYLILTMITAFAIVAIPEYLLWLKIILSILNMGLFGFIMFVMSMKTGEEAYKLKHTNDIKRRVIMETGDYYEFNTVKEYSKFKGLYIGLYAIAPLILMLFIELILVLCNVKETVMTLIVGFTYGTFFFPLRMINQNISVFWSLYGAVIIVALSSLGYYFGARKIIRQTEKIKKTNEQIYGKQK